jgi:hypothetical protein
MLRDDVALKVPTTLPFGGDFNGPSAFDGFFAGSANNDVWVSSSSTSTTSSNPTDTSSLG